MIRTSIWYAAVSLAFLALRILERWGRSPGWASSWGDDLLCMPLVLGGILLVQRLLRRSHPPYHLPLLHGLLILVGYALFFEAVLPRFCLASTADFWDLPAYALGFLFFQVVMNRRQAGRPEFV